MTAIGSTAITYDALGNPLTYGTATYTWQNGRQLATVTKDSTSVSYEYNDSGIRTSKTVNGVKHTYTLNGSQIVTESWTQSGVEYFIVYLYDESGAPIGMQYRTSNYAWAEFDNFYFEKNLFGDIVAIYNEAGTKIGYYKYDAWGACTATTYLTSTTAERNVVTNLNPFRYRGYYYDTETGLYYLQSRYYNPYWGRFLNADGYINANGDLIGFNMYAYCSNNPVMRVDYCGTNWFSNAWEAIKQAFSDNFGAAVNVGKEDSDKLWLMFITVEAGSGYSKSFDTGKPVNVYVSTGDEWFDFDEYSAGFDININGYGANIEIGSDTSAGIHLNNISVDYGMDISGHSYYQFTSELENGGYTYTKISLNHLESAVVVWIAVYAPYLLPALPPAIEKS